MKATMSAKIDTHTADLELIEASKVLTKPFELQS